VVVWQQVGAFTGPPQGSSGQVLRNIEQIGRNFVSAWQEANPNR
jgi:hypothetical protein